MRYAMRLLAFGVAASLLFVPRPVAAQSTTSTAAFWGVDAGPNGNAFYLGAVRALNGDFGRDGFLLRGLGVYGSYEYQATIGDIHGKYSLYDAMLGYQLLRPGFRIAGYVGAEYQEHRLTPFDPENRVVGAETGFKVAGDITLGHSQPLFLILAGSYSTAFETYWSRLRIGYKVGQLTLGPEAFRTGNEGSDAWRVGGFAQIKLDKSPFEITVSAGQHTNDKSGIFANKDGAYASLNLGLSF
jgi:cellulose biosynthesis protein BcsS